MPCESSRRPRRGSSRASCAAPGRNASGNDDTGGAAGKRPCRLRNPARLLPVRDASPMPSRHAAGSRNGSSGVTTYRGWEAAPSEATFNVGFSHAGLLALGVPAVRVAHLEAFRAGMAARAERLGDAGPSAPRQWQPGLRDSHLVIVMTTRESETARAGPARSCATRSHKADSWSPTSRTRIRLPDGIEHFGFEDGFSQPAVAGAATGPRVGEGTLTRWRRWRELALGEFVLGNRDEGGGLRAGPARPARRRRDVHGRPQARPGCRRRFAATPQTRLHELGVDPSWLAAKMVGRWQNGSSLARYPDAPGPPAARGPEREPLPLRRGPRRPRLPARLARQARQPARFARLGGAADPAAPHHPSRHGLRPAARRRHHRR